MGALGSRCLDYDSNNTGRAGEATRCRRLSDGCVDRRDVDKRIGTALEPPLSPGLLGGSIPLLGRASSESRSVSVVYPVCPKSMPPALDGVSPSAHDRAEVVQNTRLCCRKPRAAWRSLTWKILARRCTGLSRLATNSSWNFTNFLSKFGCSNARISATKNLRT